MLEAIIGNLIACVIAFVLLNLPLYFILKRFQKSDTQKAVASVYFKTGTIALVLHRSEERRVGKEGSARTLTAHAGNRVGDHAETVKANNLCVRLDRGPWHR